MDEPRVTTIVDRRKAPAPPASGILAEIAADLAAGDDLRGLLHRLLEPVIRLAGAEAGAVRVLSESGERLELVSEVGLPPAVALAERSVDSHCGVCGAAADGAPLIWADDLRRCAVHAPQTAYFGDDCRRVLAVPLRHRGRVLGIYNLFFAADVRPGAEVTGLLKSIGELLGLALNNARLEREKLRAGVVQERQAMAAEVHDAIGQTLTYVKMRVPLLQQAMLAHDDEKALGYLDDVKRGLGEAHTSVRQIISQFRAASDPLGLAHALQASAANFRRHTGIALEFANRAPSLRLTEPQEAQVFHIVQEALANIAKHARAHHARLVIEQHPAELEVLVEDDGSGFAGPTSGDHHGLAIMAERARRLGGAVEVGAREGGGTRVRLRVPHGAAAQEPAR